MWHLTHGESENKSAPHARFAIEIGLPFTYEQNHRNDDLASEMPDTLVVIGTGKYDESIKVITLSKFLPDMR